jgi:spore germination protein KB
MSLKKVEGKMEQKKGKIGLIEFVALTVLMIGAKLSDDTPAILYDKLYSAAWMVPFITGLMCILPIFLLLKVMSLYPSKNLHEVNLQLFGKFFGFLISFILWILGSASIVTDTRSYVDIISSMYFTMTPTIIIYGVLMAVCVYGAKRGIQ